MERVACPVCKEEVAGDAIRCPHCSSYQKGWIRVVRHPIFLITFSIGLISLSYIPMFSMFPDYAEDPGSTVEILESEFAVSESNCDQGKRIDVIGKLENRNSETLRRMTFTIEFFDAAGKTVEFVTDQEYDLVVSGESTSTFKVGGSITSDPTKYQNHKVAVIEAQIGGMH